MNVELAYRAYEHSVKHQESVDLDIWVAPADDTEHWDLHQKVTVNQATRNACGTTACYAGMVGLLTLPEGVVIAHGGFLFSSAGEADGWNLGATGPMPPHISTHAAKALDITTEQSLALFYLMTLDQVKRAIDYLADNPDADVESIRREAGFYEADANWLMDEAGSGNA